MFDLNSSPLVINPSTCLPDLLDSFFATLRVLLDHHAPLLIKRLWVRIPPTAESKISVVRSLSRFTQPTQLTEFRLSVPGSST